MSEAAIISTRLKTKVPKTHTYPLGAKVISEILAGVPQFEKLAIDFWFWNQRARFHGTSTPYQVLQVSYSGPTRMFSASTRLEEAGYYQAKWKIYVDAVPRSLRHIIQDKLLATALPAIRQWLSANPHSNEREGSHTLTFLYDELANELRCDEKSTIEWQTSRT